MATPTIPNGEEYFFPIIYEGNGKGQRVGKFVPFTDSGTIAKSCLFENNVSSYLSRTLSANGSGTTVTFSCWVKRDILTQGLIGSVIMMHSNVSSNSEILEFNTTDNLHYYEVTGGTRKWNFATVRTFEDTSKWYHIMVARNTTEDNTDDRVKIYVDGELLTDSDFQDGSGALDLIKPAKNDTGYWNQTTYDAVVGNTNNASYKDGAGYLAEVNMIDGQQLTPASFGLTDTSTGRWIPSVVKPYPTTTTTFTVTVSNPGSGNKYYIDSSQQATVTLIEGATYRFDQSDSSNSGHPLRFSTTSDGTHGGGTEFTSGVTTVGTPGSSGAYTEITVPTSTATLYYYCTNHSGMGGTANTQDQYGTNGFRLQFGTSSAMGDDTANSNDFTPNNIDATNQTTDSPTQNFATIGENGFSSLSKGNLKAEGSVSGQWRSGVSSLGMKSGKYYWEVKIVAHSNDNYFMFGICNESTISYLTASANRYPGLDTDSGSYSWQPNAGGDDDIRFNGSIVRDETGTALANDNILQFAYDADTDRLWVGKNDTFLYSGDPANGTNYTISGIGTSETRYAVFAIHNDTSHKFEVNFGQTSFTHTPPTGFVALQQDNLPETAKGVSGLVWTKNRDAADNHQWYDSSRGKQLVLTTVGTGTESTVADGLQKFLKGGQQIEDNNLINTNGESFVSWNWVANGGVTETNDASATGVGTIDSTYQVNSTAGFSIITHTGNGSDGASYKHGLSQAPTLIMVKSRSGSSARDWLVWHHKLTSGEFLDLNNTEADFPATYFTSSHTIPTASVITCGTSAIINGSSETYVTYAWHEVEGFSKFGKYTGNGSTDGPFVYTGFLPAWFLVKRIDTANDWQLFDSVRNPFNPVDRRLYPNLTNVEAVGSTSDIFDFTANGFKVREDNPAINTSGGTYIYMAFAEHPFVGDGTNPVTAR